LNQISNFQQLKNPSLFLFSFFFSILPHQYSFSYLSIQSHTLIHIFFASPVSSSALPRIRPTNPIPLVIFELHMPAVALLFTVSSAFNTVEPPYLL
jgi:hypothetical protein